MADEEDEASKTEDPSERKLSKAREEGDVPISLEVKSWLMLFAGMMFIWAVAPRMMRNFSDFGRKFIAEPDAVPMDGGHLRLLMSQVGRELVVILLVPFGLFFFVAIVAAMIQVGFLYAPKRMELKWDRLNPVKTLGQIISVKKLIEMFKDLLKIFCVLAAAYLVMQHQLGRLINASAMETPGILDVLHDILLILMFTVVLVMMVFAFADYFLQKFQHRKKLRMTKHEVKEEYKQMEGDPHVKAKLRSIRMERFRQRMMAEVPKADVIITNPTHYSIALRYNPEEGMHAPKVVAKGVDFLAMRIREMAKEHEVPLVENPPLARALYAAVEIDQFVPEEHFKAVAEIISYVYELKGKTAGVIN